MKNCGYLFLNLENFEGNIRKSFTSTSEKFETKVRKLWENFHQFLRYSIFGEINKIVYIFLDN